MEGKLMLSISRKDLYDKLWTIGITKTATELSIPNVKLKTICTNNDIPLPTASYWGSLQMRKDKPFQTPLPNPNDNSIITIENVKKKTMKVPEKIVVHINEETHTKTPNIKNIDSSTKVVEKDKRICFSDTKSEQEKLTKIYNSIKINKTLSSKPHSEIVKYLKKDHSYWENRLKISSASREIIPEVLPFIDSLLKMFETAGAKIVSKSEEIELLYKKYIFTLNFNLPCTRVNLSLTDKDYTSYNTYKYVNTGKINVEVGYKLYWHKWGKNKKIIKQTKNMTSEDLLRKVFIYIFSLSSIIDEKEKEHIIEEEIRLKKEQEKFLLEERIEKEQKKTEELLTNSMNYFYSRIMKEYITAEIDETTDEYKWAMDKADWIQNSSKYPDGLLTEQNKKELLTGKEVKKTFW